MRLPKSAAAFLYVKNSTMPFDRHPFVEGRPYNVAFIFAAGYDETTRIYIEVVRNASALTRTPGHAHVFQEQCIEYTGG